VALHCWTTGPEREAFSRRCTFLSFFLSLLFAAHRRRRCTAVETQLVSHVKRYDNAAVTSWAEMVWRADRLRAGGALDTFIDDRRDEQLPSLACTLCYFLWPGKCTKITSVLDSLTLIVICFHLAWMRCDLDKTTTSLWTAFAFDAFLTPCVSNSRCSRNVRLAVTYAFASVQEMVEQREKKNMMTNHLLPSVYIRHIMRYYTPQLLFALCFARSAQRHDRTRRRHGCDPSIWMCVYIYIYIYTHTMSAYFLLTHVGALCCR